MTPPLPRLAAFTIEREQVSAWLVRYADMPLRFCLAPAGSGKTTALVTYARSKQETVFYFHLKHRAEDRSLEELLCTTFDLETYSYAQLIERLSMFDRIELIFDGVDRLHPAEQALLERLVYEVPSNVGLIYAGTTTSIALHRLEAVGLAMTLPRSGILFSLQETRALALGLGLTARDEHLFEIHEHCNGWAVVLADILRAAVENETSLVDAYERWVVQRGRSFSAYLEEEIGRFPEPQRELFYRVVAGEMISEKDLTILEDVGGFVISNGANVWPYNVINDLLSKPVQPIVARHMRLSIRMFGRFSIRSGDREVTWIRRRDQQIFRYVAIRSEGRVKKSEIISVFWPDADPHLAAQSLRTACSNIRKALASVMESQAVEQIFFTDGQDIVVNLTQAVIDVHRFRAHINEGHEADNDGRLADALAHYYAAERLCRSDLFAGEPREEWFLPQCEVYRGMLAFVIERIAALAAELEIDGEDGKETSDRDVSVSVT